MRAIKFRGKRLDNGEWVYGTPLQADNRVFIITSIIENSGICCEEVHPDTVGQFTCLHDKNGKEIYEGDILKVHYYGKSKVFGVVKFNYCRFYIDDDETEFRLDPKTPMSDMFGREYEWEVIGNIYDNPDLLKG